MTVSLSSNQRAFLASATLALLATQIPSCQKDSGVESPQYSAGGTSSVTTGGNGASGGNAGTGGLASTGGSLETGGGAPSTGGSVATGGSTITGGTTATGGTPPGAGGTTAGGSSSQYVVSLIQSSKDDASDITQDDITSMVTDAVTQAGGFDFIQDGQTVVLKPNLLSYLKGCWMGTDTLPATVNGVTTDWRVTKAVADLVRAKNPTGQILVMEGSNRSTTTAFTVLGYTTANFGSSVDAFIALEGASCDARNVTTGLIQKPGQSGMLYWINEQYFNADIVISIGAMKTHSNAGTTGCVKNLGIGATPNAMYSAPNTDGSCTRNMSASDAGTSYIDHSTPANLGAFVADYYSVRPADFAVMDGLQGLQHGPCSMLYPPSDLMNMRLILASKNAVALDTIQALVMGCDPTKVPVLTKAESYGLGTTDSTKIGVVGNKQVADVKKTFLNDTTTYPLVAGICN